MAALLAVPVLALDIQAPREIVLDDEQRVFSVLITNDSGTELPLRVLFWTPNRVTFNAPDTIEANKTLTLRVTAQNPEFLRNSTYESRFDVKLGNEIRQNRLRFVFLAPVTPAPIPTEEPAGNANSPWTGLVGLGNNLGEFAQQWFPLMLGAVVLIVVAPLILATWLSLAILGIFAAAPLSVLEIGLIVVLIVVLIAFLVRLYNRFKPSVAQNEIKN